MVWLLLEDTFVESALGSTVGLPGDRSDVGIMSEVAFVNGGEVVGGDFGSGDKDRVCALHSGSWNADYEDAVVYGEAVLVEGER